MPKIEPLYAFPARPPTWIERWVASGGHCRRLRARDAWFAARWAHKHGFELHVAVEGYTLRRRARSAFSELG